MTSTNVTKAAGLLLGNTNIGPAGTGAAGGADNGFSEIMNRTSKDSGNQFQKTRDEVQSTVTKAPVNVSKINRGNVKNVRNEESGKTTAKEEEGKISDTTEEEKAEIDEATEEIVEEAVTEIKEAIQEELGISEEELESIMSILGLTAADLLQPENMQAIAMAVAGETDELSMLTNETLYQNVQNLTNVVETVRADVQAELGVDDEQFAQLLEQMEVSDEPQEAIEIPELSVETESREPVAVAQQQEEVDQQEETEPQQETAEIKTQTGEKRTENSVREEETQTTPVRAERNTSQTGRESGGESHESGNPFLQGWNRTGLDAWEADPLQSRTEIPFETVDTQDVMNQITEYMRMEARPEITELQLRLQPETLGTLHIHLTAKEGALTAQFAAENEAVKAVLEAQVVQLKENLSEQGIKVEAVEVTIASHEFDRNFAQNGEQNSQYQEPRKKGVRKIQLDDNIPLDEMELSDEERLTAEMMEQNGNTVDFMA